MLLADTLMTFESSYEAYTSPDYTPNPWTASNSRKIWHIIFNVPADKASEVAELSLNQGAGFIHITDDNLPNPYDTIPDDGYMQTLINVVSGGEPAISDPLPFLNDGSPASQPTGLIITAFDYSSVSLSWSLGSSTPLALAIYLNGKEIVRLPGTMTHATIGNRNPGSSGLTFTEKTIESHIAAQPQEATSRLYPRVGSQELRKCHKSLAAKRWEKGFSVRHTNVLISPS
ncbi:hypothetical protein B7463_g7110, partial [Scytalidium lignicola]